MRAAVVVGGLGIIIAVAVRRALESSPPMHWSSPIAARSAGVAVAAALSRSSLPAKLRARPSPPLQHALMPG